MNRILFGVVVDSELYEKYNNQSYHLKSEGADTDLKGLEARAFDRKQTKTRDEALKIVERIKREVKEHYAAENGRKGYKAMRHDSFKGYLDDVKEIQEAAVQEYAELQSRIQKARENWKEQQKAGETETWLAYRKAEYLEAEDKYRADMEALNGRTKQNIDSIRGELQEHLSDFYTPNGSRLDDDTVRLLHSGLKLSQGEYNGLVEKNTHNPTMIRLLADFGEEHKLLTDSVRTLSFHAKKSGAEEMEIFDNLGRYAENSVRDDKGHIWQSHFEKQYNDCISDLSKMAIMPEQEAAAE